MTITFADYVEKLVGAHYTETEKEYLNDIFMTREESLKPRRKDPKSERRTILALLAKEYEEFMFDTIKRRMEEQSKANSFKQLIKEIKNAEV